MQVLISKQPNKVRDEIPIIFNAYFGKFPTYGKNDYDHSICSENQKLGVVSTQSNQNTYTFKISSSIPNSSLRLSAVDKGPLNSTQ